MACRLLLELMLHVLVEGFGWRASSPVDNTRERRDDKTTDKGKRPGAWNVEQTWTDGRQKHHGLCQLICQCIISV